MEDFIKDRELLKDSAYINGEWVVSDRDTSFSVMNPATGKKLIQVADIQIDQVNICIENAAEAFLSWKTKTAKERSGYLREWYNLILQHADDLATIMTLEQGKPLEEAKGEVLYGASFIEWFAEEAKRTYGDIIPGFAPGRKVMTLKQPIGVVAAITPWNFPIAMITRKVGPALAAGCTIIVKPSEETPLSALALAELASRAGIPKGVFNVITSTQAAAVGKEFCENSTVRKLSFTGSTAVGKVLMHQCADQVKKLSLELGGNAPFIVFEDADLEAAVEGAIASKYRNAGQTCICANRIYIQEEIYETFAEKLAAKLAGLKVGEGLRAGSEIGPLINEKAVKKVLALIEDAREKGGDIMIGGRVHAFGQSFFEPTVILNAQASMALAQEEVFGPVAPLFNFKDEQEVIQLANNTKYGLAAYFYAKDVHRVWRVAEALEYGMVGINTGLISTEVAPFGGVKESGIGREGSKYGIEEYMEIKYLCMAVEEGN
ncbi:NAD-dependent succinate-semialdehyde dehydrogenase [Rapidithrix thailandica]|uniref:NAD-dependent succinate-semialdehyde dehydrogenase n=1 Tax=Rapidithrix thailandica TaxID=413964 RepID=A0AAW9SAW7_9BACT